MLISSLILSGALHYFRVHPAYWEDRLLKLRAMGLNTVETYVPWNAHEPRPGEFHFEGGLDVARYVALAGELGLKVIVRPGPYICSEWDFGGLPAWLLKDPGMRLRCLHPPFVEAVERYFDALLPRLAPLQATRGGPLIAMQVENEYGSYGNDRRYLERLAQAMRVRGVEVTLFTSDGPRDATLQAGALPGVWQAVNFGLRAPEALERLRHYQPDRPPFCAELWVGWFDHWGEAHHVATEGAAAPDEARRALQVLLEAGAHLNVYMFHGGTNFGFMNGANWEAGRYQPTITSYDYSAPLDEAGNPTPAFFAFRDLIQRHAPSEAPSLPPLRPARAYGRVALEEAVSLFESLDRLSVPRHCTAPEPMEALDQAYGFILYRTRVSGPRPKAALELREVRDRAQVFLDGRCVGVLEREFPERTLSLEVPAPGATLEILVENQGRVNFGPALLDRKGITEGVCLGQQYLFDWEIYPLPLDDLGRLAFSPSAAPGGPAFYRGWLEVDEPADTFLALPGGDKGVAWINGFNLGRYWKRGPQQTLYLPAPLLRPGRNELIVLELHAPLAPVAEFRDRAEWADGGPP